MGQRFSIEVQHLRHRYGERVALEDVSFNVESGECFGLMGPNGGGKTTTFKILSTLMPPSSGQVLIFGEDAVRNSNAVRARIGVVFQSPALDKKLSVEENLFHHGYLYGLSGKRLNDRVAALLSRVRLWDRRKEKAEKLSGGLRRRLEIAKSLVPHPSLLLLDEPTSGLDPLARREIWEYLHILRKTEGITIVVATHLTEEADQCDHVIMLDEGKVVAFDSPLQLKGLMGGDILTMKTPAPEKLGKEIERQFGIPATVVGDEVRLEVSAGHEFIPKLVTAFPQEILSITLGKPTLEDLFIQKTGRRFAEATQ